MAALFVVEDGTGVVNANSFATVEGADQYFEDRGIAAWTGDTLTVKQPALVRATDYINNRFTFVGRRFSETQALEFPRLARDCISSAGMPIKLQYATYEYALRALNGELAPDPEVDDSGYAVTSKDEEVGPIKESTSFAIGTVARALFRPYPAADLLLRGLVASNRRVIRG